MYSIVDSTVPTAKVSKPPVPLPFHMQFVAGAIAGVSEILTMYPLDGTPVHLVYTVSGKDSFPTASWKGK